MEREMSGRTIEDFFTDAGAFDALSDEDKARLIAGETLEGETNTEGLGNPATSVEESGKAPEAATVNTEKLETPAVVEPVVLAKDGQHTIPFSELEAARERARLLEQQVIELQAGQAAAKPAAAVVPETQPIEAEIADLRRQYREAMYAGDNDLAEQLEAKIDNAVDRRQDAKMAARDADRQEKDAQESAVSDAQSRAAVLVEKYPFLNPQGPATNRDAIDLVVAQRDRLMGQGVSFADAVEQAVAKVAPLFDKGITTPQTETVDVAAKAAEAISKAKAVVPTSLSQVPAGSSVHHDEGEAIRSDSGLSLINRFLGKSPEEIEKIVNRVI